MAKQPPKTTVPEAETQPKAVPRILMPATKPTHFTMAEIRRIIRQIETEQRGARKG